MLMKKISLLLVGVLALFSCEQEVLDDFVDDDFIQVGTRAVSSISDFDPISELVEIPVNIVNVGSENKKYLTANISKNTVSMASTDDGSLNQRWYIKDRNIIPLNGNVSSPKVTMLLPKIGKDYPILENNLYLPGSVSILSPNFYKLDDNTYQIYQLRFEGSSPIGGTGKSYGGYLQVKDKASSEVKYRSDGSSTTARWQIVPVGNFKIIKMDYEQSVTGGDFIERKDQFVQGTIIPGADLPIEHTIDVTSTVSESSNFSKADCITTQEQSSFGLNIGLEVSKVQIGFNGQISNSTTSAQTVTYGKDSTYTMSVSQSFKVLVPANNSYRIDVLKMSYNSSLTYVATLEKIDGIGKGKRFRIKGKWNGVVTTYLYYRLVRIDTGEIIDTRVVN